MSPNWRDNMAGQVHISKTRLHNRSFGGYHHKQCSTLDCYCYPGTQHQSDKWPYGFIALFIHCHCHLLEHHAAPAGAKSKWRTQKHWMLRFPWCNLTEFFAKVSLVLKPKLKTSRWVMTSNTLQRQKKKQKLDQGALIGGRDPIAAVSGPPTSNR